MSNGDLLRAAEDALRFTHNDGSTPAVPSEDQHSSHGASGAEQIRNSHCAPAALGLEQKFQQNDFDLRRLWPALATGRR